MFWANLTPFSLKYMWPHPEGLAAALLLHRATGKRQYLDWYYKCWEYCYKHIADTEHGGWCSVLTRDNK